MIQPLRGYALVLLIEEESKGKVFIPDQAKEQPQMAEVIAIGDPEIIEGKEYPAQFKVGDIIYFGRWQGMELRRDRKEHRLLKFEQVFAKEVENVKK